MAFLYAVTFLLGLVIGSFLNVCIYRLPRGKSVVYPPSSCPGCNSRIKPYHNIPVLSYLLLGGRCASCGTKISPVYPAVELLNALLYVAALYRFGPTGQAALVMAIVSAFIVVAFVDMENSIIANEITYPGKPWRHRRSLKMVGRIIPNEITYPGIPLALVLGPLVFHTGFLNSFLGAVIGGGFLFGIAYLLSVVIKVESLGFGDVKLMAMIGAFLGWKPALLAIFIGSSLGSAVGLGLIYLKKMDRRAMIPFGPFLVIGGLVTIFFGQDIVDWYFGHVSLP